MNLTMLWIKHDSWLYTIKIELWHHIFIHYFLYLLTYLHYILFYVSQKTFCRYYILSYVRQKTFCSFFFANWKTKDFTHIWKQKVPDVLAVKLKKSATTNVGIKWFAPQKLKKIIFFLMQCPRRNLKHEEKIEANVHQIVLFCEF